MPPVPYVDVLARNLRVARAAVQPKLSQADVGARMRALGFTEWRRQTMGNAEKGARRLTAEEIAGLAVCLDTTVFQLMLPAEGTPLVELRGGQVLPARRFKFDDMSITWDGNVPILDEPTARQEAKRQFMEREWDDTRRMQENGTDIDLDVEPADVS